MACSISTLGECVAKALFKFIIDLLNLASKPFLDLIKKFLSEPVNITIFASTWSVIVYILSMFYGLLFIWVGFKFIISGESPEQREKAKSDLKNIIIMMILVQGSFHLYSLIIAVSSALTKTILNMVGNDFFKITLESIYNIGFDLFFGSIYILHLIVVLIILILRYIAVSAGVLLFAMGIFFYFISALNQYGRLIINGLGVLIFLPVFYALIFLVGSKLTTLGGFSGFKTLIMVGSLDMIILFTLLLLLFVVVKSATQIKNVTNIVKR